MEKKKWKFKLGVVLISISVIIFLGLFVMPFLGLDLKSALSYSTVIIIAGEAMFWIGTLLVGKEVWLKFKNYIKSGNWLEKKKEE